MLPTFSSTDTAGIVDAFLRDGVAIVNQAVTPEAVRRMRELADHAIDVTAPRDQVEPVYGTPVLRNTQSVDPFFAEFLTLEPFATLNRAILGADFGFCGQNVIRSGLGQGISRWHVDDVLELPLSPGQERHDASLRLPVLWFSYQIALSDILSPDDGPTEIVAGSHYSGKTPPRDRLDPDETTPPEFAGRRAEPVLCRAGDIYLFNHQLWHRGSPNRSGRVRYLMQNQYCRGWLVRRFHTGPHRACDLPADQRAALSPEARRLLGVPAPTAAQAVAPVAAVRY